MPVPSSSAVVIIFRMCLAMAYLRYYSLIPMALLFGIQTIIVWVRLKKLEDGSKAVTHIFELTVSNIGVVTAYDIKDAEYGEEVEDEKDVLRFIKTSTIASFIYHLAMLMIIMIMGRFFPDVIDHGLENRCDFPLEPGNQSFFWVFGAVLFMGFYSLTAILYRAPTMVKVETGQIEREIDDEHTEKVSRKDHDSDLMVRLDEYTQVRDQASVVKLHKNTQTEKNGLEMNYYEVHEFDSKIPLKVHATEEVKNVSDEIAKAEVNESSKNNNTAKRQTQF